MITRDVQETIEQLKKCVADEHRSERTVIGALVSQIVFSGLIETDELVVNQNPVTVDSGNLELNRMVEELYGDSKYNWSVITVGGLEIPILVNDNLNDVGKGSFTLRIDR